MTYQEFKQKVDALWEKFWTGGITNPLSVIEQITYLIFLKMLDEQEDKKARTAKLTHKPYKTNFPNFKINPFDKNSPEIKGEDVRWRNLRQKSGDDLLNTMRDKVFPFLKQCDFSNTKAGAYLKDAYLLINKPSLLSAAINDIDDLPLEQDDIKGNLYEYLLSKLSTAGINGQFRTPRHIIKMIVELVDPKKNERIADPNQLPQGWKEEELGKLADVIAGQSPEGIYYNTVGDGTPFYQGKSEFQEMYLGKPTKWTTKVTKLAKRNDILMSVRAPVGPVNITQEDICIGRGLAAITAKSMLLQLYLFYHLRYLEDKISGTNGAVFASISKREIEQIKITYPTDKDEQQYIVKTLDAVAEMIKLRKETIKLTKDLKGQNNKKAFMLLDFYGLNNRYKAIQRSFYNNFFNLAKYHNIEAPEALETFLESCQNANMQEMVSDFSLNNHPKLWHDFIDYVLYDYNNLTALWEEIKEYNKLKYYC